MKGILHEKGFRVYTYMDIVMKPIQKEVAQYNWLIAEYDCNNYIEAIPIDKEYVWISGDELINILNQNKIQFIWGIFSAFPQDVLLSEILSYGIPSIEENYKKLYGTNPVGVQHPLAVMDMVPCDSSWFILISKDNTIVDKFIAAFPESRDLEAYNAEHTRKRD